MIKISKCPDCGEHMTEGKEVFLCPKCGDVPKYRFYMQVLGLPQNKVKNLMVNDKLKEVKETEDEIYAYGYTDKEDLLINSWSREGAYNEFPCIYPKVPSSDLVIIVRDPYMMKRIGRSNCIAIPNDFVAEWGKYFYGKEVVCLYTKEDEEFIRRLGNRISNYNRIVRVGEILDTLDESVMMAEGMIVDNKVPHNEIADTEGTLKGLIQGFHYTKGTKGICYRKTLNVALEKVVTAVVNWFKKRGAKFIWDDKDDQGYMIFKDKHYRLSPCDPEFKSMMFHLGGIIPVEKEAAGILEGMSVLKNQSIVVSPKPWIEMENDVIRINQGNEDIIIDKDKVRTIPTDRFTYAMLEKTWFKQVDLIEITDMKASLKKLDTLVMNFFPIPEDAKEMVICWLLSCFLRKISPINPGLRLKGFASTGKSTILKLLFWLFYGGDDAKLPQFTGAGLWRKGTIEPVIFIDNENVESVKDQIRTFLDLAATKSSRYIGDSNSGINTKEQHADSLVAVSGLDTFLVQDVLTRYIEVETGFEYQKDYYEIYDKRNLLEARDEILSAVFTMLKDDVIPTLREQMTRENNKRIRSLLETKERITDYFILMLSVGRALQKYEVIDKNKDLEKVWTDYIRTKSNQTAVNNALSIEWWKTFKLALLTNDDPMALQMTNGNPNGELIETFKFIKSGNLRMGIEGDKEELIRCLAWAARVTNRTLPWKTGKDMIVAHREDKPGWESLGWEFEDTGNGYFKVRWGQGI